MNRIPKGLALTMVVLATASCGASMAVGAGAVVTRTVLQERSTMDALRDTETQLSLNNSFLNHSGELFRDVSTNVTEGRVVLTGSVPKREHKIEATRISWETEGVTGVTDELTVQEDSGALAYVEDAWISNRLRVNLLTDSIVSSVNYSVETVDGVVHLTGLARSNKELGAVINHAAGIPGVARVVSHVLTIDDPRRQVSAGAQPSTG